MSNCHTGCHDAKKTDYLFWGSLGAIVVGLSIHLSPMSIHPLNHFGHSVFELVTKMWWGILLGMFAVGLLHKVPREFVVSVLGGSRGLKGVLRATLAGLLLDLCNHGILLVGTKLYERGASLGQMMAFLIASPWNSFTVTVILISLVGLKLTLIFIALSALIAIISGVCFEWLVEKKILSANPNQISLPKEFHFFKEARTRLSQTSFNSQFWIEVVKNGSTESKMILRWLLFGIVVAALINTFLSPEQLKEYFGPSLLGLGLTLVAATIIEVCSEGSTPIGADLVTKAQAPGNGFAFLMTGVSTDYTEILAIKETTKSLKIALFLPLVSVPQIILIAWILNQFS